MRNEKDVLNTLPFGVLSLEGERIAYANRLIRSLFEVELTTLPELCEVFPELECLLPGRRKTTEPVWVNVAANVFCVSCTQREDRTEYCFMPSWFVSSTDQSLEALQSNFDDFMEIFENCFDGIYVADGDGRTLWMNAGFERCYGISARNFLGRDASKLEREGYLDPLITWKIISTKKRHTALQTTKSGRKVLATGIPLLAADGSVRRVIINSRDTTELIEMQGKLTAAESEIKNYESEIRQMRENSAKDGELSWFSEDMHEIVRLGMRVGRTDAAVSISGPSGVGKRKLSDLIFRYSKRNRKRLIRIGFGDLPEEEIVRDLFGSDNEPRDQGILARSLGGTLILERVDLMTPQIQERLAVWLRDKQARLRTSTPEIRLISTSQTSLEELVSSGQFREDLYFRLNVAKISIPPLGGRVSDIAGLSEQFLEEFNSTHRTKKRFDSTALNRLARGKWPGNVRELRMIVERLVVTETASVLSAKSVEKAFAASRQTDPNLAEPQDDLSGKKIQDLVRSYEASLLRAQVQRRGSIQKAADATGISVSTIKRKLSWAKKYHPLLSGD